MLSRRSFALAKSRRVACNSRDSVLHEVITGLKLDFADLNVSKKIQVTVINTVFNLYTAKTSVAAVSLVTAAHICRAYKLDVSDDDSIDDLRSRLHPQFFSADEIRALSRAEVQSQNGLETLRDWGTSLDVSYTENTSIEQLSKAILVALFRQSSPPSPPHGINLFDVPEPESPKRPLQASDLVAMSTEEVRRKYQRRTNVSEENVLALSRPTMTAFLMHQPNPSILPADTRAAREGAHLSYFDHFFLDNPGVLPSAYSSHFRLRQFSTLVPGNVVGQFVLRSGLISNVKLYQVSGPSTLSAVVDPTVVGTLSPTCTVWSASESGLLVLQPALARAPIQPPVAVVPPTIDLEEPSALDLLQASPSPLDLLSQSKSSVSGRNSKRLPHPDILPTPFAEPSPEATRRLEQYEAGRGFRTLLGPEHSQRRYLELTGNTGKFLDITYTNVIVLLPLADRGLPGLSRQLLPFLLRLNFGTEYSATKPWATHLQAFRPEGLPFQYVGQIHTALAKMVDVLDIIRNPTPDEGPCSFFLTLFEPVFALLRHGGTHSLARLPVARVITTISNLLLEFGAQANHLVADTWKTEEDQRVGLRSCMRVDIQEIMHQATLDLFQKQGKQVGSKSGGPGNSKQGNAPSGGSSKSSTPAPSGGNKSTSSTSSLPSTKSTAVCISALLEKYKIIPEGCRRSNCPFRHDLNRVSSDDERTAAARISKPDIRAKLEAALG